MGLPLFSSVLRADADRGSAVECCCLLQGRDRFAFLTGISKNGRPGAACRGGFVPDSLAAEQLDRQAQRFVRAIDVVFVCERLA